MATPIKIIYQSRQLFSIINTNEKTIILIGRKKPKKRRYLKCW